LQRCPDLAHLENIISTPYQMNNGLQEVTMSAGRTDFAQVVCVSDRRHLTFSDRHLSQEATLLILVAMVKLHFAG
jgi:hypothetical protein